MKSVCRKPCISMGTKFWSLAHSQNFKEESLDVCWDEWNFKYGRGVYSADRITGIVEDKEGNLWFGTDGFGICKYDGKTVANFTTENGLCGNAIYELMVDSKGNIWIGTFWGGVSKYDGEKFTNYTKDGVISGVEVSGFFEDGNGDIWFGVENNGVYKYDGNSFSHYYKEEGLDASVLSIYRDKKNRFWFGGWGGLFRYDGKSFSSVTKDGPWK